MIYGIWAFLSTGTPLWTESIDQGSEIIDEALVSGLLSATNFFSGSVLGGELKSIIIQGKILHQVNICNNYARIAILLDERIAVQQMDIFFDEADKTIKKKLKEQGLSTFGLKEIELDIKPIITDVLGGTITQLKLFNDYLKQLFSKQDEEYERLFKKIYKMLPFLINQSLDVIIQESESKKVLFSHHFTKISAEKELKIVNSLSPFQEPNTLYAEANLDKESVYLISDKILISHFVYENYLFTIFAEMSIRSFKHFISIVKTCKEKLIQIS